VCIDAAGPDNLGMTTYDWVSFTTDYGEADGFVAACRGVIARIAPAVRVIDVSHQVPPQDVRRGAGVLAQTVPWLPPAVHLAVVDPGVGTERRGVCIVAGQSALVGPDNGLLLPAADILGGPCEAYELENPQYWQPTVSATFHGRDVFAPVVGHLCNGVQPAALGRSLPVDSLTRPTAPIVAVGVARIEAEVQAVDGFGNVQLAATAADLAASGLAYGSPVSVQLRRSVRRALLGETFGDVGHGELVVYVDSAAYLAIAVNGGSAAAALNVRTGDTVLVAGAG
jgi:S-adenosyl-L-methionine hydrolase (adenosine-forming)